MVLLLLLAAAAVVRPHVLLLFLEVIKWDQSLEAQAGSRLDAARTNE